MIDWTAQISGNERRKTARMKAKKEKNNHNDLYSDEREQSFCQCLTGWRNGEWREHASQVSIEQMINRLFIRSLSLSPPLSRISFSLVLLFFRPQQWDNEQSQKERERNKPFTTSPASNVHGNDISSVNSFRLNWDLVAFFLLFDTPLVDLDSEHFIRYNEKGLHGIGCVFEYLNSIDQRNHDESSMTFVPFRNNTTKAIKMSCLQSCLLLCLSHRVINHRHGAILMGMNTYFVLLTELVQDHRHHNQSDLIYISTHQTNDLWTPYLQSLGKDWFLAQWKHLHCTRYCSGCFSVDPYEFTSQVSGQWRRLSSVRYCPWSFILLLAFVCGFLSMLSVQLEENNHEQPLSSNGSRENRRFVVVRSGSSHRTPKLIDYWLIFASDNEIYFCSHGIRFGWLSRCHCW